MGNQISRRSAERGLGARARSTGHGRRAWGRSGRACSARGPNLCAGTVVRLIVTGPPSERPSRLSCSLRASSSLAGERRRHLGEVVAEGRRSAVLNLGRSAARIVCVSARPGGRSRSRPRGSSDAVEQTSGGPSPGSARVEVDRRRKTAGGSGARASPSHRNGGEIRVGESVTVGDPHAWTTRAWSRPYAVSRAEMMQRVVADVALFYGERSGGIRTYLDEKARLRRQNGAFEHHVMVPAARAPRRRPPRG